MGKPRIYFDTKPLIDAIKFSLHGDIEEERRNDVWHTRQCMQATLDGMIEIITSTLTIAECKRAESAERATDEAKRLINSILTSGKVIILAQVTQNITERARDLDWIHGINLRSVDAVHVATAMETECQELFTGDGKMLRNASKFEVLGLRVVRPSETQLLPPDYRQGNLLDSSSAQPAHKKSRARKSE